MLKEQNIDNIIAQAISSYVDYLNDIRLVDLMDALETILTTETDKLTELANKSESALSNLDWAKTEINNLINTNRGGNTGLHGFIAEFAEAGIRNARDAYQGLQKSAILLNDNSSVDMLLQGQEVQMKFYNNILDEIKQAANYREMKMLFPKDHVEVIKKIMAGAKTVEINGNTLSSSRMNQIKEIVEAESAIRGVSYDEWLEPSVNRYRDIQKNTINKTLFREESNIIRQTNEQESAIRKEADRNRLLAQQEAKPSFQEASKVAGIGAVVQGGLNLGLFMYRKHKEGKEVWNFDIDDWKECGITVSKGAVKGGVSGYAIYGLTNVCNLAAPSAGAITSGTFGLSNAIIKYRKGEVDTDGFIDLVVLNAIDATGAAIGAAVGQTIIPFPVVGALIGSIAVTTSLNLGKGILNKSEIEAIKSYQDSIDEYIDGLDNEYKEKLNELFDKFHKLGELQQYSFDFNVNLQLRFASSINLAKLIGVSEESILKNEGEIDRYFLS